MHTCACVCLLSEIAPFSVMSSLTSCVQYSSSLIQKQLLHHKIQPPFTSNVKV